MTDMWNTYNLLLLSCVQEVDGEMGSFALKMWTYRVLLELLHWADHASLTLHVIHTQSQETEEV